MCLNGLHRIIGRSVGREFVCLSDVACFLALAGMMWEHAFHGTVTGV